MKSLNKKREYQSKQVEEDLYQFEMGNELGAQLERNKDIHEQSYKKEKLEQLQQRCRVQNKMNGSNQNQNNE